MNESIRSGEEILLSLLFPVTKEDMTREQAAEFAMAAADQEAFDRSPERHDVLSEAVGDVRVTYRASKTLSSAACPIAPAAAARLLRCGLLTRWV